MKKSEKKALAKEIYDWCVERELWGDSCIYFDGKAWASWRKWREEEGNNINERLYEYSDKCCTDYFEYGNPDTLSMSFEGNLYTICNAYWENEIWLKWYEEFMAIFEKYNGYAEFGDAWNLTFVED